ncbi:tetratricopeptide repeat protein [Hallella bergensis]|uniref:tetratricopeptide repeat protein n=1 Tax=Hallella bergensis TaxID=242750 RepID=UPI0039909B66
MRKHLIYSLSILSILSLASCSKMGPLSADNFTVTPNPLETQGGQVPATINGMFPAKYMKTKAVVTITPELRYGNGQVAKGQSATFQGENVMGNDQTVSYKIGGRYTMKTSFDYVPEMQQSEMFLTFNARLGKKKVNVPAVKVATGVLSTSELYKQTLMNAGGCIAPDSFQRVKAQKTEANIRFLVNQANIRQSELKNNSVQEFVQMLRNINADREKLNLRNVEVRAYASPEGGYSFNNKLAGKRQDTSEKYVKQQLQAAKLGKANIDAHYTAQDWDGFKRLVQASNIQDKDVILRVLEMYKDPEERERQIRNMSAGFRELADGILPELRRSRLIINYETIGRSDEQIKQQYANDPARLSPDELLYAATLESETANKEAIYKKTAEIYDKDYRAFNNLATLAFNEGNEVLAKEYIQKAFSKNPKAPEANANLALIALKHGNLKEAESNLANAIDANGFGEVLGNLNIAKGNYATAVQNFGDSNSNSAALAQILNKDYAAAVATLKAIKKGDAMTDYLMAVVLNRQGNIATAKDYLQKATAADPRLATYAAKDLEFSNQR